MPNPHPGPPQIENIQLRKLIEQGETTNKLLAALLHQSHINNEFNHKILRTLRIIAVEVAPPENPVLSEIKIGFQKGPDMPVVPGPVTLTAVGQTATTVVLGFDQLGQPFTGTMPTATLSSDDTAGAIITFDPATGGCVAVANGTANVTANLTTAEGLALTDTEQVIVAIPPVPPPTQVLSSIKIGFIQVNPLK